MRRTGRLLVVHEAVLTGGLGAEIAAIVAERLHEQLKAPVARLATADIVLPANTVLERALIPDATAIVQRVRTIMEGGRA